MKQHCAFPRVAGSTASSPCQTSQWPMGFPPSLSFLTLAPAAATRIHRVTTGKSIGNSGEAVLCLRTRGAQNGYAIVDSFKSQQFRAQCLSGLLLLCTPAPCRALAPTACLVRSSCQSTVGSPSPPQFSTLVAGGSTASDKHDGSRLAGAQSRMVAAHARSRDVQCAFPSAAYYPIHDMNMNMFRCRSS